jgi:hypothetical protein
MCLVVAEEDSIETVLWQVAGLCILLHLGRLLF